MTGFKTTVRVDCALDPSSVYKSSSTLAVGGSSAFELESTSPHPLWWLASKIKQIFSSTSLASFMAFEWFGARPHFQ